MRSCALSLVRTRPGWAGWWPGCGCVRSPVGVWRLGRVPARVAARSGRRVPVRAGSIAPGGVAGAGRMPSWVRVDVPVARRPGPVRLRAAAIADGRLAGSSTIRAAGPPPRIVRPGRRLPSTPAEGVAVMPPGQFLVRFG